MCICQVWAVCDSAFVKSNKKVMHAQEITLKLQGGTAQDLVRLRTVCRAALDISQYADQGASQGLLTVPLPFTSESGFVSATEGLPQLQMKLFMSRVQVCLSCLPPSLLAPFLHTH